METAVCSLRAGGSAPLGLSCIHWFVSFFFLVSYSHRSFRCFLLLPTPPNTSILSPAKTAVWSSRAGGPPLGVSCFQTLLLHREPPFRSFCVEKVRELFARKRRVPFATPSSSSPCATLQHNARHKRNAFMLNEMRLFYSAFEEVEVNDQTNFWDVNE